jgi:hypothetical protein
MAAIVDAPNGPSLKRSLDSGATWQEAGLPPGGDPSSTPTVALGPADANTLFASGAQGLYRTADQGATWDLVLPGQHTRFVVAISEADTCLVYAAAIPINGSSFQLLRSTDHGATWTTLVPKQSADTCVWSAWIWPHPTDARRVLASYTCAAGRNYAALKGFVLRQSFDQGSSWQELFSPPYQAPARLVGGSGSQPHRFFLAATPCRAGTCIARTTTVHPGPRSRISVLRSRCNCRMMPSQERWHSA